MLMTPGGRLICFRLAHPMKALAPILVTPLGIVIWLSALQSENSSFPICVEAGGQGDRFETRAAHKRLVADGRDAVWKDEAGQSVAELESERVDALDTRSNRNAGQRETIRKGGDSDFPHASGNFISAPPRLRISQQGGARFVEQHAVQAAVELVFWSHRRDWSDCDNRKGEVSQIGHAVGNGDAGKVSAEGKCVRVDGAYGSGYHVIPGEAIRTLRSERNAAG